MLIITAVLLYSGTLGASLGFSAILLPQLQANTSTIPTDENTGSWIGNYILIFIPLKPLPYDTSYLNYGE